MPRQNKKLNCHALQNHDICMLQDVYFGRYVCQDVCMWQFLHLGIIMTFVRAICPPRYCHVNCTCNMST